jgi:hypothetical protein
LNIRESRLGRYFGLRPEGGETISKGGIEHLLPGRLSGWVVGKGVALYEVRLLVGPHLIARAEINQPRPDVCETLGWQGQPGYTLILPPELPPGLSRQQMQGSPRLLALSADGTAQVPLTLMQRPHLTKTLLEAVLRSELLGLDGHCDGLQQGAIRGWAGRRGEGQPVEIWLQAAGKEPLAVRCDQRREGMEGMGLSQYSGFNIDLRALPPGWAGLEVWCSFDRQDQFRLPQVEMVLLPDPARVSPPGLSAGSSQVDDLQLVPANGDQSTLATGPDDLGKNWQALESLRLYLDKLEHELDRRDRLLLKSTTLPRWLSRFLGSGR